MTTWIISYLVGFLITFGFLFTLPTKSGVYSWLGLYLVLSLVWPVSWFVVCCFWSIEAYFRWRRN